LNRGQTSEVAQLKTASAVVKSRPEYKVCSGQADRCGRADGPWSSGPVDSDLAEIVDEFTCRIQAGEALDLDDYVALFPQYAQILRDLLKDLRGLAALDQAAAPAGRTADAGSGLPRQAMLGDFAICAEIGRGGMGVVYEAEQISLGRRVALKVLSMAAALDVRSVERFQIEAQAAACLQDDHIVPVYAVGAEDGVPFYVMQYIEGASLAGVIAALRSLRDGGAPPGDGRTIDLTLAPDLLADRFRPGRRDFRSWRTAEVGGPDYIRAVVRLAVQAAEALEHAHDQGIIHRDIKPANLLLDHSGKLWITDFGLARIVGSGTLTATGDLPGTLRYMSPEQALGKRSLVDRRSDIYALGATLYELLSLEPAIDGHERWEILAKIGREEPTALKLRNPAVPRDLATIVAKAMAKDVADRYQTAGELAQDLNLFLEGRPINARPASPVQQAALWCRRNRAVATLLIALAIVFTAAFVTTFTLWRQATAAANRANRSAVRESILFIAAQGEIAARDVDHGLDLASRGWIDQAVPFLAEAVKKAPSDRPELEQVARANLAAWETQVASLEAIFEHHGAVTRAIFRPDGRAVLTASRNGTVQLWDTATGRPLAPALEHGSPINCIAFSADGRRVLTGGTTGTVRLWNSETGQPVLPAMVDGEIVDGVEFAPDGRTFVSHGSDRAARLRSTATGQRIGPIIDQGNIVSVGFSPDGRALVTCGINGAVRLWDTTTVQPLGAGFRHGDVASVATISPDGRLVATGCFDGTVQLWETAIGSPRAGPIPAHGGRVTRAVFSPDGAVLMTAATDGSVRLWDVVAGRPIKAALRHDGVINECQFSPDGKLIVTAGGDHTARLWDGVTGRSLGLPMRHQLPLNDVAFAPDGKLIMTASEDGTAKLWRVRSLDIELVEQRSEGRPDDRETRQSSPWPAVSFSEAVFSPDRKRVLVGSQRNGLARLIDTSNGQTLGMPMLHRWSLVRAVAFSPDGRRIATASHNSGVSEGGGTGTTCQIWDGSTGRTVSPLLPHINFVSALNFHPGGMVLATGDYSGAIHLWDVESGELLGPPFAVRSPVICLAFSPDGRTLAAGTAEKRFEASLWDVITGQRRGEPIRFKESVSRLAFSPDGRFLAIGSRDTTARLVEVATGRPIGEPLQHRTAVRGMAFSPDSRHLLMTYAETARQSAARLWDVTTGHCVSPMMTHAGAVTADSVAFSSDGTLFATGCKDGSVHLWHVNGARPIGPSRLLRHSVLGLAFTPDGRSLMAVDDRGNVRAWPVSGHTDQSVEQLMKRFQVRTGLDFDSNKESTALETSTWRKYREQVDSSRLSFLREGDIAWHELCAGDAEAVGDAFAARWHLDRLIASSPGDGLLYARRAMTWLRLKDDRLSRADIACAINRGPRDRILDWLTQYSVDLRVTGRLDDALRVLDFVITARPGDWRLIAIEADIMGALARTHDRDFQLASAVRQGADTPILIRMASEQARSARWAAAARLYDRAIAQGVVPFETWKEAALAHLVVGDEPGYRRICEIMRSRFPAQQPERWVAHAMAEVCGLAPGGTGDDGKALAWGESVLATISASQSDLKHRVSSTHGANLYREGRDREAIAMITEGIAADGGQIRCEDAAFLAMAYQRSGQTAKARQMLARQGPDEVSFTLEDYWDVSARNLLRRETRQLILDPDFPSNPFAP
jgi:WD40 repeat protein/serine/threonine protein kinase